MMVKIINPREIGLKEKKRTRVFNSRKAHAWVHYYAHAGDHDDLHCHSADQVFMCIDGQCTLSFPDGGTAALDPGMAALINGGTFYRLENTGSGPMILMGWRSGDEDVLKSIDYATGEDIVYGHGRPTLRSRHEESKKAG